MNVNHRFVLNVKTSGVQHMATRVLESGSRAARAKLTIRFAPNLLN